MTRAVVATSWSKSLAIPGERIGYLAFSPRMPEAAELFEACTFTSRVLGFVNAPALWQWVVAEVGDLVIDVAPYREKRDLMYEGLTRIGYQCVKPQGAFYVFPRTPIDDDVAFVRLLAEEGVLTVPGSGFGMPGHIRISLTVERETVVRGAARASSARSARHGAEIEHGSCRRHRGASPCPPPITRRPYHVIYGLHAVSLITGIVGVASVVGAFLTGWPSIIAVIVNYVKRSEVRGTWLDSHFRWQIRTFWFGLLWVMLCAVFVVATLGIGLLIAWLPLALVGIWFVYRILRGWLRLIDRQPMYH